MPHVSVVAWWVPNGSSSCHFVRATLAKKTITAYTAKRQLVLHVSTAAAG